MTRCRFRARCPSLSTADIPNQVTRLGGGGADPAVVGCSAAPLADSLDTNSICQCLWQILSCLWQPKMSSEISTCFLGGKVASVLRSTAIETWVCAKDCPHILGAVLWAVAGGGKRGSCCVDAKWAGIREKVSKASFLVWPQSLGRSLCSELVTWSNAKTVGEQEVKNQDKSSSQRKDCVNT